MAHRTAWRLLACASWATRLRAGTQTNNLGRTLIRTMLDGWLCTTTIAGETTSSADGHPSTD
jgi:hypothetical protein